MFFRLLIHCILFSDFWTFFRAFQLLSIPKCLFDLLNFPPLKFLLSDSHFSLLFILLFFIIFLFVMSFCLFSFWFFFRHFFHAFQLLSTPKCLFDLLNVSSIEISSLGFAIYFSILLILSFSFFTFSSCPFVYFPFNSFSDIFSLHSNCYQHSNWNSFTFIRDNFFLVVYSSFFPFSSFLSFSSCPFIYFPFDLFFVRSSFFSMLFDLLFLILCLDQCVAFLSYNSRVCSYEFAS